MTTADTLTEITNTVSAATSETLAERLDRYESRILTADQRATMHADICATVVAANPPNASTAIAWMTVVSGFIRDIAPAQGGPLWEYLTDAKLATWQGQWLRKGRSTHTLRTRRAILDRLVRVHRGGPTKINKIDARKVRPAPLSMTDVERLLAACEEESLSALRGFAAHIGAGVMAGVRRGDTFVELVGELVLRRGSGNLLAVAHPGERLSQLVGEKVHEEDWDSLCRTAFKLRLYLNPTIAIQTFRQLATSDTRRSLAESIHHYRLNELALSAIAEHLPPADLDTNNQFKKLLRDGSLGGECTQYPLATPSARPNVLGQPREVQVPRKVSRAESRRRAKEFAAQKATRGLPEVVAQYISSYTPDEADDVWRTIESDVREMLRLGGYRTVETTRKHAVALTALLRWRASQHYATKCPEVLTFAHIDDFYARGLSDLGDRSKRDYRSRLRTLASRVNTSSDAPPIPTTGYNAVRPGYTSSDEAKVRMVAQRQRRPETRRRLCVIVGLGGGAGVSPVELRLLRRNHLEVTDEGIVVRIQGASARSVVVRRDYEPLVLAGIEGLDDDDLLIDVSVKGANPISKIINDAEVYEDLPKIDLRRLRSTWISWLLQQRIPLQLALQAAGLTSARTFSDMARHLPRVDDLSPLRDGGSK